MVESDLIEISILHMFSLDDDDFVRYSVRIRPTKHWWQLRCRLCQKIGIQAARMLLMFRGARLYEQEECQAVRCHPFRLSPRMLTMVFSWPWAPMIGWRCGMWMTGAPCSGRMRRRSPRTDGHRIVGLVFRPGVGRDHGCQVGNLYL